MSSDSIFHGLIRQEDDYTQLLCNFLRRFDDLRVLFLEETIDRKVAVRVRPEHIMLQHSIQGCGRPDLTIQNEEVCLLFEVKVVVGRGLTPSQSIALCDIKTYSEHLRSLVTIPFRRMIYLLPSDWKAPQGFHEEIKKHERDVVKIETWSWNKVIEKLRMMHGSTGDVFISEFLTLLHEKFGPVNFSPEEKAMLFSQNTPVRDIRKLDHLISRVATRASKVATKASNGSYKVETTSPDDDKDGEEYGFYLSKNKRVLFWFGAWTSFWEEEGWPLSFGVSQAYGRDAREAFSRAYKGATADFADSAGEKWTLGWFESTVLEGDPEANIWEILQPVLEAVSKAG